MTMARQTRKNADQIPEDRALVRRLLAGDERTFERFYGSSFPMLYRFALTRLDHDEALAEEIVQATLTQVVEKLDTYRGEATLFSWMCTFCRYEISAHFRRQGRRPSTVELSEDAPEIRATLEMLASGLAGPEEDLQHRDLIHLIHRTLDDLPPRYGHALEWKYLDDIPVAEIAARLEVSTKAAESILTRAREAFRRAFEALISRLGASFQGLHPAAATGANDG